MLEFFARRSRRRTAAAIAAGALGGATATAIVVALANPVRRRRARDHLTSVAAHTADLLGKARRDAANRLMGAAAARKSAHLTDDLPDDETLVARARTALGRLVSHPHAVDVLAHEGRVILSGPILRREANRFVRAVRRLRGVRDVENRLEIHERPDGVPSLQGARRARNTPELLQEHWTPSLRVGAGLLGIAAMASAALGLHRPKVLAAGVGLGTLGALLLARASFDRPIARILGIGDGRRSVEFQKTLTIRAPVDEVFAYWSNFERFPEFMDHVESVSTHDGRSHWRVRGPLGTTIGWEAETTSFVFGEKLAWKSVGGSLVKHAGIVRFQSTEDGRATRLDVRLSYNPVVGYLGHLVAAIFQVDPKKSLDDDLLRMKSLIEQGKATAHGHEVTREEIGVAPRL